MSEFGGCRAGSARPFADRIRRVSTAAPFSWLAAGWRDFRAAGWASLGYGLIFVIVGLALAAALFAADMIYLFFPLASGFVLIGPALAIGLYVISRDLEHGIRPSLGRALRGWLTNAGPIFYAGLALLLLLLLWLRLAQLLFALCFEDAVGPDPHVAARRDAVHARRADVPGAQRPDRRGHGGAGLCRRGGRPAAAARPPGRHGGGGGNELDGGCHEPAGDGRLGRDHRGAVRRRNGGRVRRPRGHAATRRARHLARLPRHRARAVAPGRIGPAYPRQFAAQRGERRWRGGSMRGWRSAAPHHLADLHRILENDIDHPIGRRPQPRRVDRASTGRRPSMATPCSGSPGCGARP